MKNERMISIQKDLDFLLLFFTGYLGTNKKITSQFTYQFSIILRQQIGKIACYETNLLPCLAVKIFYRDFDAI